MQALPGETVRKEATAVVFEQPGIMSLRSVGLTHPTAGDCTIELEWSGISTGTERLLWDGRMPPFPGLDYPLVPGYESVGRVTATSPGVSLQPGQRVFVPGSRGFTDVKGLFGGAAAHLVVPAERVVAVGDELGDEATLLALAATAYHAVHRHDGGRTLPDLVIGHGVLGRLVARLVAALGRHDLVVWESESRRLSGAEGYQVLEPTADPRADYELILDVSGDADLLDALIGRLAPGGAIVLGGFYNAPLSFAFPPAFMREIRLTVAAEWQHPDLESVIDLVRTGRLSLSGLITHRSTPDHAADAYDTAFNEADCLKMILDWSSL
jgi:3-hydroxyethyl bacteriochlorophyllide a dehydrogenase